MKTIPLSFGFFLITFLCVGEAKTDNGPIPPAAKSLPRVSVSGKGFITADGKPIRFWGLNYSAPQALLEDDWMQPGKWLAIEKSIKDIEALGANLVRVAVQYNTMMESSSEPNQENLQQLRKLALLAQEHGLYFMVSGLGAFSKADQPAWYDSLDESARWATQALYWESIAGAIGDIPAVFAYELMNEPIVPSVATDVWLPGEGMGGNYFAQNITRTPNGREMKEIMSSWIKTLTAAIRKKDTKTPVTVGFLPFANFGQFSEDLDINNTHIYPKTGEEAASNAMVQRFASDKPLIVTETFALSIGTDDWEKWIKQNNADVAGWVGMHGKTLQEITPPKSIVEAIYKAFYERFRQMSGEQK